MWYRPPDRNEDVSINSLEGEIGAWRNQVLGTILVGDLNIHHVRWLYYSNGVSTVGKDLRMIYNNLGLRQTVRCPTHLHGNLLDLILTDLVESRTSVLPRIADHNMTLIDLPLTIHYEPTSERLAWQWQSADWIGMSDDMYNTD